jgi:outer membrane receptor protein involved in Fe transport
LFSLRRFIVVCLLFSFTVLGVVEAIGQRSVAIRIVITDDRGDSVPQATVYILDKSGGEARPVQLSDSNGVVRFAGLQEGYYTVLVRHLGKLEFKQELFGQAGGDVLLEVVLRDTNEQLSDVVIRGKNENQTVRDQSIKAVVLNTREVASQPATLTDLMNRSAGVRIRQTGGLGSNPDVSVNGFQGRAIRYFRDGVPLDYLRDGYNIASVPIEMLERVEVYKGVLPVSLGADALGGAVNLVSRKELGSVLNASYEVASFNTHRVSVNGRYAPEGGKWFAGGDFFFNHSDNDYKAIVKVTDPETKNQYSERLPLFHNAFTSYYGEVFGGVRDTRWADELRLSIAGFSLTREQQHPALMTDPYGAIMGSQASVVPTLRYKKTFLNDKISIDQFLVYNTVNIGRTDTLRGRYDWFGNVTYNPLQFGETRQPAMSDIDFSNFTSRTNLSYQLNSANKLEVNYVITDAGRKGRDPYGPRFEGTDIDVLSVRTDYQKRVLGVNWESNWFGGRLVNTLMGKQYSYTSAGTDTWAARPIAEAERITKKANYWGIADAVKYQLNDDQFVRLSVEVANRLPQQDELFGDGIWVVPNFNLNPERSTNFNLGYRWQQRRKASFEVNTFYRRTTGLILLIPIQPPYAQYNNMDNVKGYGVELDGLLHLGRFFVLNGNLTYQDLRLFGISKPIDRWKNGSRLRNTPWFFANLGISSSFNKIFRENDNLKVYLHYNLMKEYYLETIARHLESKSFLGLFGSASVNSELKIPTQHLVNAGVNYSLFSGGTTLGLEIKNILNQDVFDYYRIQRAGRSIHFKIGISIK